jgi:uncharacterized protein YjbI with pentapeptide repeats
MNRRRVSTQVLLYFFMLMLLTATVGCSNNGEAVPVAPTAATYSISGVVALTGGPLASVTVTLSGKSTGTYTTGADGTYIFNGLTDGGTYTLTPILAGYTFNPASKVVVINGSNMTADFVATSFTGATYNISGKVTGVEGLNVKITFSSASTIAEVLTDGDGTYTSPSLPDGGGPYTVTPYLSGYSFTPANISGITLSGANSTGNNFVSETANFTQADLEGTWNFQSVETGSWNGWVRGTVTIASDGTVTFESCLNRDGACSPASVVMTIDSTTGVIADSGNADNHYSMASNKTFIAGTQYDAGTPHPALIIFQKKLDGTVYANTDLKSKSFVFHQLNVGSSNNKWKYGAGSTSSTGAMNISSETDPSGTDTPVDVGVTISVDSSGVVSMSDNMTWKGFLSADKRTIVGTVTEGTEYHMMIIQIIDGQSGSYMRIVGISNGHILATGVADPAPFWAHQFVGISGGVMSSLDWVCSNSAVTIPGSRTISISSSGAVTLTGSDFNGQLSYDDKFMVGTETFATGVVALDVITF